MPIENFNEFVANEIKKALTESSRSSVLDAKEVAKLQSTFSKKLESLKHEARVAAGWAIEKKANKLVQEIAKRHDVKMAFLVHGTDVRGKSIPHVRVFSDSALDTRLLSAIKADIEKLGVKVTELHEGKTRTPSYSFTVDVEEELDRTAQQMFQ